MDLDIRRRIELEEFDYQTLSSLLSGYSNPRMKINALLKKAEIIRVKKGIYVFGEKYSNRPYSKELLANWIYGPSIVSMDYMLSWYGLIPETVTVLTSTTVKRPKTFATPVGDFIYRQVPYSYSLLGMCKIESQAGGFLAGTPERALADKIRDTRGNTLRNQLETEQYLFEDLRLDEEVFLTMDPDLLTRLSVAGRSRKIAFCASLLKKMLRSSRVASGPQNQN
ncbi:MAG TPA: hypothetical protein DC042_06065 [Bacteroidales bacterium]|nr:hypothetical protein [Bacteroidales bacterium]